jgi:hypothetical protein
LAVFASLHEAIKAHTSLQIWIDSYQLDGSYFGYSLSERREGKNGDIYNNIVATQDIWSAIWLDNAIRSAEFTGSGFSWMGKHKHAGASADGNPAGAALVDLKE